MWLSSLFYVLTCHCFSVCCSRPPSFVRTWPELWTNEGLSLCVLHRILQEAVYKINSRKLFDILWSYNYIIGKVSGLCCNIWQSSSSSSSSLFGLHHFSLRSSASGHLSWSFPGGSPRQHSHNPTDLFSDAPVCCLCVVPTVWPACEYPSDINALMHYMYLHCV